MIEDIRLFAEDGPGEGDEGFDSVDEYKEVEATTEFYILGSDPTLDPNVPDARDPACEC